MAETKQPPLLSLDTLSERRVIQIDGQPYDLLAPGQLSLVSYHRIGRRAAELEQILGPGGEISDDQVAQLSVALDEVVAAVLVAPDEVRARLSDAQKMQVFSCFSPAAVKATPGAAAPEAGDHATSTGERTSPASSGSTAAVPASGSRRSRKP